MNPQPANIQRQLPLIDLDEPIIQQRKKSNYNRYRPIPLRNLTGLLNRFNSFEIFVTHQN